MVKTYAGDEVAVIVGGFAMEDMSQEGDFLVVSDTGPRYIKKTGIDGQTTRSKQSDRSGTVTLRLNAASVSNKVLTAFAEADDVKNQGVIPIMIKDGSGEDITVTETGWIESIPDVAYGAQSGIREWVFDCSDLARFLGGTKVTEPV